MKFKFFPIYANNFCDVGQVPILIYLEAWTHDRITELSYASYAHKDFLKVFINDLTQAGTSAPES